MDTHLEELQQVHPEKNLIKNINQAKLQQLHKEKGKLPKIKIEKIKSDTPEAQPHVTQKLRKQ